MQWLGTMSSGLGSCSIQQEMEGKENQHLEPNQVKVEKPPGGSASWEDSRSERPSYSYVAMIQFAINRTEETANRYLTLGQVFKQQKQPNPELRRNETIESALPLGTQRKMKPLLLRVSSDLVPIQFPANQPLVLQPSVKVPLPRQLHS
uniref:Uncharacterized protein n=1 Tax=Myotis myotis TaxID=51298 RepID=A0A7J7WW20_MYOMY|nr:hypothetical protein mMyoMyo1_012000 [Myotis myotis]